MSESTYITPKREILSQMDMPKWMHSQAYSDYVEFLSAINESVKRTSLCDKVDEQPSITKLLSMLDQIDKWIDEIPPIDQPQRYGNKAYRDWYTRFSENSESLLESMMPSEMKHAIVELKPYMLDSFGNATRIDYGTGHEAAFLMFLCCLVKISFLTKGDYTAIGNRVFEKYVRLCRKLQQTYRMEPAGSHGVWSLDDYQFVPFYWGSAQLIDNSQLDTKSFLQENIVERCAEEYSFMGCIKYINQVKTGPFYEHSNQLFNISAVPSWSKVNSGLLKMYEKEVYRTYISFLLRSQSDAVYRLLRKCDYVNRRLNDDKTVEGFFPRKSIVFLAPRMDSSFLFFPLPTYYINTAKGFLSIQ